MPVQRSQTLVRAVEEVSSIAWDFELPGVDPIISSEWNPIVDKGDMRAADFSNFERRSSRWLAKGTRGAIEPCVIRTVLGWRVTRVALIIRVCIIFLCI